MQGPTVATNDEGPQIPPHNQLYCIVPAMGQVRYY